MNKKLEINILEGSNGLSEQLYLFKWHRGQMAEDYNPIDPKIVFQLEERPVSTLNGSVAVNSKMGLQNLSV